MTGAGTGTNGPTVLVAVPERLRAEFFRADEEARLAAAGAALAAPGAEGGRGAIDGPGGRTVWLDGGAALLADDRTWPDVEVLVTCWGQPPLDAPLLDRLPRLRLAAHTGGTVRPFVTPESFARGVAVTQAGQGMARSVAEVALTFTLALLHQVPRFDHALRTGAVWERAEDVPPRHEVLGTPVGVVGASRTGRAHLEVLRALGARPLVADPYLTRAEAADLGAELLDLDDLLAASRVVALHAPTLPETHHLIDARRLALLPDGAGLVNTARSWLVDEDALLVELRSGRIDAALDVFDAEPLPVDHPLRALPNVLLTPHHAAGTVEGRLRQGRVVLEEIERLVRGEALRHTVTETDLERMA
jgi:phosphoglycerate dehydrogenase-like enzyme